MKQTRQLEDKVERYGKMCTTWDDLMTICEMALEENDESMLEELKDATTSSRSRWRRRVWKRFFPASMTA